MRARVQRATAAAGFDPAKMKAGRPIVLDDQDLPRRGSGFFWPRRAMMLSRIPGPGPRCGLGAVDRRRRQLGQAGSAHVGLGAVDRRRRQLGQAGSAAGLSNARCGCGPWAVSGQNSKEQDPIFLFPGKLNMQIGSKEK